MGVLLASADETDTVQIAKLLIDTSSMSRRETKSTRAKQKKRF